jgi:pantoate--beta-alanine ligase
MMHVAVTLDELRSKRAKMSGVFGLVPTMGALHEGHAALIRRARVECDHVGVSIFVNPSQFSSKEDLSQYPKPISRDLEMLLALGVDLVWTPTNEIVYPPDFQTWVTVEQVSRPLEGAARPGHFRGVATVVAKLFNAFQPQRAYFGQKDAQQVVVIRQMIRDLNFPIELIVCETLREPDGLAMSSRNVRLSSEQRKAASILYRSLSLAKSMFHSGESDANALRDAMRHLIASEPLSELEYVSIAHPQSLQEIDRAESGALVSMAVRFGSTRLIDNIIL